MQMQKNLSFIYSFLSHIFLGLKNIYFQLKKNKLTIFSNKTLIEPEFKPDRQLNENQLSAYIDTHVKQSIAYQEQEFERWKIENIEIPLHSKARAKQRYWMVFWSALASFFILMVMVWLGLIPITTKIYHALTLDFLPKWWPELTLPSSEPPTTPVFFSFITLLISAPVAYAIWMIRDENAAQQIENSRKDTNLKDFQRLSEWASGFHLPEDKIISSEKTVQKGDETTTETITTTERFSPPSSDFMLSRRTGAESLQVAAIYQIQKFMYGKYGEQFMIPAFYLIYSIWDQNIKKLIENIAAEDIASIRKAIFDYHNQPLARAMNNTLTSSHIFHLFSRELEGLSFTGLVFPEGSNFSNLDLSRCNFNYSEFIRANFTNCVFDQTTFHQCQMSGSVFFRSDFSFCQITACNIERSNFSKAKINATKIKNYSFIFSKFDYSIFFGVSFMDSCLRHSKTRSLKITGTTIKNTELFKLNLEDKTPEQIKARWTDSGAKIQD